MQFRYQEDPNDPEMGDVVIDVQEYVVSFWREIPETLDEPPYFCFNLALRKRERRQGEKDYFICARKDYSETWTDICCDVRKDKLLEALELYKRRKEDE